MTHNLRFLVVLMALVSVTLGARQQPATPPAAEEPPTQPRFRAGANLVRVDAYVMADGMPVTDLTIDDFDVLEDSVPQRLESFQLVQPRGPAPQDVRREPNTVAESREMAREADSRVFVLFLDTGFVQIEGSYRAQAPLTRLLDQVIGQDDLVGVMTPDMSPRNVALGRRTASIENFLKEHWAWGQRNRLTTQDPREQEIMRCYPDVGDMAGLADEMIRRRRERQTLDALEGLIVHLEGIREERKFVVVLSEGWLLARPDERLARPVTDASGRRNPPGPPGIGMTPQGRLTMDPDRGDGNFGACERERSLLAYADHESQFLRLLQRANRANVSFYPLDARGLVVFDEPIGPGQPPPPSVDAARLSARHGNLRALAENTDGYAIINTNAIDRGLERMMQDTRAYYLLGYYSSNTRLDGRFRKLTVRVNRDKVDVRSRPGYLAPTEAELASTRVEALMNGAPPGHTTIPPSVARAFAGLAPIRGTVPVRVHTLGAPGQIWLTGEFDAATLKSEEWQQGGRGRVSFQHDRGESPPMQVELTLDPGQRTFQVTPPSGTTLAPGRYVMRVELTARDSAIPLQTTVDVTVPRGEWLASETGLVTRRGPYTGLNYVPTADARFRRTERLRFEVPRADGEATVSAHLLGRDGQPLAVAPTLTERVDTVTNQRFIVADLTLAPLAQGEYAIEVAVARGDQKESASYAFRIIP
ncbi:MAG TPA: VWA domain-containing protein [Vicinamibacterales bacterium]|nr:VWA domain-containing protein [Vicinamibacterales bacterium]